MVPSAATAGLASVEAESFMDHFFVPSGRTAQKANLCTRASLLATK